MVTLYQMSQELDFITKSIMDYEPTHTHTHTETVLGPAERRVSYCNNNSHQCIRCILRRSVSIKQYTPTHTTTHIHTSHTHTHTHTATLAFTLGCVTGAVVGAALMLAVRRR